MYFLCFLFRRRMWLQCLVLQTTAIGVEIWLQFSRLERIWIKISFNLTRHLVRLNLTAHAVLQTTFCNHHKFITYYHWQFFLFPRVCVRVCVCLVECGLHEVCWCLGEGESKEIIFVIIISLYSCSC